ncbi:hypothetical protein [Vibrio palustris]|uniref:hypothetical protein n=1 Tax=Vibrio palustris TaxID=1918946 RepID=UPI00135639FD|nr:hypothetical protein [Vibrio palustris]
MFKLALGPKALIKSKTWNNEAYTDRAFLSSLLQIIKDQQVEKEARGDTHAID